VRVTTAAPLSPESSAQVTDAMHRCFGANARVETSVDAALVGGLTIRSGDTLVDGSVRRSIADMKAAMLNAPVGAGLWSADAN
jgi:F-type H+-transporting ATPase subunit delta